MTPNSFMKDPPQIFETKFNKTDNSHNAFTAQEAGIYSQKEFKQIWKGVFFAKPSDDTLRLLKIAYSYDFMS